MSSMARASGRAATMLVQKNSPYTKNDTTRKCASLLGRGSYVHNSANGSNALRWNRAYHHGRPQLRTTLFSPQAKPVYLKRNIHVERTHNRSNNSSTATTTLSEWIWQQVKIPKGFENFFPKNGPKAPKTSSGKKGAKPAAAPKSGSAKKSTTKKKESVSSPFETFGKGGGSKKKAGAGGGGPGNNGDAQQIGALTVLTLAALALRSLADDETNTGGKEITWTDFRNFILEPNDVDRIVVINKKTARVFLRPGAQGVPSSRSALSSFSSTGSAPGRSELKGGAGDDNWENDTVVDMGAHDTLTMGAYSGSDGGSPSSSPSQQPLVYHFNIGSVESFEEKLAAAQRELNVPPRDYVPVQYATETNWTMELLKSSPTLLMIGITAFLIRGMAGGGMGGGAGGGMGNIFKVGKSNAKKIKKEDINVTFKDVAGCQEAKKEIMEFVDFLQDSSRFTKLGAKIPKGALLCGPPGTGKTLLAKAVAGEASVPFYSISGSDFIEMFVGVGPSRVRDLFKEARANAPCIIFIDEIDAVGKQRGRGGFSGGNDERENTLNQLLVEMDGFNPSTGVVVLAGTNRVDTLDQALTRPGRFDRQIQVDKPDLEGRKEIFHVHLQGISLDGNADEFAGRMAGLTPGFAGADIANICNEAAIQAARRKGESVTMVDFEKATDRIIGGLESNKIMSIEERSIVAHHEAGHAVAGWFLEHADPLLKVTIIPRSSGALGYAQYLPKEVNLRTQDQIMDVVCMALAGRAAEEIFFGRVTTGASDDLRRVTEMVYSTIQIYGMNEKVGQLAFPKDPNAMPGDKPYSDATAQAMDEEARIIIDAAYARTLDLMREKKAELKLVAEMLLEKEMITHDDVFDAIGPRPFKGDAAYDEYVSARSTVKNIEELDEDSEEDPNNGEITPGLVLTNGFGQKHNL